MNRSALSFPGNTPEQQPHTKEELVKAIKRSIEVDAPVRTAYNQWTQLEKFPRPGPPGSPLGGWGKVIQSDEEAEL